MRGDGVVECLASNVRPAPSATIIGASAPEPRTTASPTAKLKINAISEF